MSYTVVQIGANALVRLGESPIHSFTEGTNITTLQQKLNTMTYDVTSEFSVGGVYGKESLI